MKRSVLQLSHDENGNYHSIIKNEHGRRIYICLTVVGGECQIINCFYIDRVSKPKPKKLTTLKFKIERLLQICKTELDKDFESYEFNDSLVVSEKDLIAKESSKEKYNILILLKEENLLKTIFKNRFRREIYLEVQLNLETETALIKECTYCDKRGKETDITPYAIRTIYFDYSFCNLLNIVNKELEGGFTDIIVTENHTITLDRAICGSI